MQLASMERTRLFVDGVQAAITADITRRRDDGMVVAQALPFLRLDTPVTGDDGRRTRIARVTIAMEGDVPKLLLELLHDHSVDGSMDDGSVDDGSMDGLDGTAPAEEATVETFTPGVSTRPARTDSTVPYEFQTREKESAAAIVVRDPSELAFRVPAPEATPWYLRFYRSMVTFFGGAATPPPS